jgi:peptidoglycan hydrolase CwlO-like protein
MVKSAVARGVDVDPIDRLEDKVKLLVDLVTQLRAEQQQAADEQARLVQEADALRARLTEASGVSRELMALREERDVVRTRVADMLEQLEHLSL